MNDSTEFEAVRFHNIGFSTEGVTLFDEQSRILFVEKKDVRKIMLKYGYQSERPTVQVLFGIAIVGLGLYFILDFLLIAGINRIIYDVGCLSPLLIPVGGWFIVDGIRKRLYFDVSLDNDRRKFPLGKAPDKDELKKFIRAGTRLGYSIDSSIIDQIR